MKSEEAEARQKADAERRQQVEEALRAAGACPGPGKPVPESYLRALLAMRDLAIPG